MSTRMELGSARIGMMFQFVSPWNLSDDICIKVGTVDHHIRIVNLRLGDTKDVSPSRDIVHIQNVDFFHKEWCLARLFDDRFWIDHNSPGIPHLDNRPFETFPPNKLLLSDHGMILSLGGGSWQSMFLLPHGETPPSVRIKHWVEVTPCWIAH